mmetsp:Transcript_15354/g.31561  ORF Transcript_15354/g.31561 Transcript_15354/m.31561 type:complete len:271 (-) Transcript_15354:171-983(-)
MARLSFSSIVCAKSRDCTIRRSARASGLVGGRSGAKRGWGTTARRKWRGAVPAKSLSASGLVGGSTTLSMAFLDASWPPPAPSKRAGAKALEEGAEISATKSRRFKEDPSESFMRRLGRALDRAVSSFRMVVRRFCPTLASLASRLLSKSWRSKSTRTSELKLLARSRSASACASAPSRSSWKASMSDSRAANSSVSSFSSRCRRSPTEASSEVGGKAASAALRMRASSIMRTSGRPAGRPEVKVMPSSMSTSGDGFEASTVTSGVKGSV